MLANNLQTSIQRIVKLNINLKDNFEVEHRYQLKLIPLHQGILQRHKTLPHLHETMTWKAPLSD